MENVPLTLVDFLGKITRGEITAANAAYTWAFDVSLGQKGLAATVSENLLTEAATSNPTAYRAVIEQAASMQLEAVSGTHLRDRISPAAFRAVFPEAIGYTDGTDDHVSSGNADAPEGPNTIRETLDGQATQW